MTYMSARSEAHSAQRQRTMPVFESVICINNKRVMAMKTDCRGEDIFSELEACIESFSPSVNGVMLEISVPYGCVAEEQGFADGFCAAVRNSSVAFSSVILQIRELPSSLTKELYTVCRDIRKAGAKLALGNIGMGDFSDELIAVLKPDIVCIGGDVTEKIDSSCEKQSVFRHIMAAARRHEVYVVADGITVLDEAITCMVLEADWFGGSYFSDYRRIEQLFDKSVRARIDETAKRLNVSIKKNEALTAVRNETYKRIIRELADKLSVSDNIDDVLQDYVDCNEEIVFASVINDNGIQISTPAYVAGRLRSGSGELLTSKGSSHQIKNYFYAVHEKIEDPFISQLYSCDTVAGVCRYIASGYYSATGERNVACVAIVASNSI